MLPYRAVPPAIAMTAFPEIFGCGSRSLLDFDPALDDVGTESLAGSTSNHRGMGDARNERAGDNVEKGRAGAGAGRWGQLDLVGSMAEWNFGWWKYGSIPEDQLGTSPIESGTWRTAAKLVSSGAFITYSSFRQDGWGLRCARAVHE